MSDTSAATRWTIYALLITVSAGLMLARIARVRSPDPKNNTPFLSANDRSRWATIRALGDDGTYAIDHIVFNDKGDKVRGWHTIDMVRHRGPDGREHYYSSKPTLLTTLLAGEYWLLKTTTGATLEDQTFFVARIMLVLTNVVPLVIALVLLARLIDRVGWAPPTSSTRTDEPVGTAHAMDFARCFLVAAACFATFLTTYAVTLNNHVIAGMSLIFALAAIVPMWQENRFGWTAMAWSGFWMAMLAANELPALSILVFVAALLAWKSPFRTALAFVPAALVVGAAAVGTNVVAHGDWRTPYAHRGDGSHRGVISAEFAEALNQRQFTPQLRSALNNEGIAVKANDAISLSAATTVEVRESNWRWKLWDPQSRTELALARSEVTDTDAIHIYHWDNWYDYEGSYWRPENLEGIDVGEASPFRYAFNVLVGHHGLFSLTPIWLISALGCGMWLRRGDSTQRLLAAVTIVVTLVVVAFYLSRPQIDRNYGGGTCCLRWLIWLTPLWLLAMLPAMYRLSRNWPGRAFLLLLLAASVFSAHYAADNPWSHPWIFDYWTALGWINY